MEKIKFDEGYCVTRLFDGMVGVGFQPNEFKKTIKPILSGLLLEGVPEQLSFDYPNPASLMQDTYLTEKVGEEVGDYLNFYVDVKRVLYLSYVHIQRRKFSLLNYLNSLVPWNLDNHIFIDDDSYTFETRALQPVIPFLAEFFDGKDFSPHIMSSVRSFREAFLETEIGATIANKEDQNKVDQWVNRYKSRLIPYIKEYRAQIYVEAYQLFSKNKREGMDAYAPRRQNIKDSFANLSIIINSAINKLAHELANSIELMECKKIIAEMQQGGEQNNSASETAENKAAAERYLTECKNQRKNPPKDSLPQLMATASKGARNCWTELSKNGFFDLPKIKELENVNSLRLLEECLRQGVPFTVALMDYLEYPKHVLNDVKLSKEKYYNHLRTALGVKSSDNVKKNCLSLTNENYHDYKAWEKVDDAKRFYEEMIK